VFRNNLRNGGFAIPSGDIFTSGLRAIVKSLEGKVDFPTGHQTQTYPDRYHASRDRHGPWHWTDHDKKKNDQTTTIRLPTREPNQSQLRESVQL